ncbi:TetR/AcrR family transcriptional regulator [Yinghuangia seranimata]|uniref:TetR/AcrR family transcriptional regulator n=1 Tax=Yinghuangia seranimata TaxID=408067 RepID=UPI00248D1501|nr:TetR/AcrR family transcriptional regulator [Yinghuangia seranimata]MDI2130177.1 helix-turn-helix domain-containing protein [Yinghuangia seranimata]
MGGTTQRHSETAATPAAPLRADAQRNRQLVIDAAREVFIESGPDAPLDEIARRAGVGIATLYRRFPDREDLIRGVVVDTFDKVRAAAERADEESAEPLEALRSFMHYALDAKIAATMPALIGRVMVDEEFDAMRRSLGEHVEALIQRAQAAGKIRPDIVFGDITLMLMRLSRPLAPVTDALLGQPAGDPLAHRQLDIYLDGLRAGGHDERHELPEPRFTLADFDRIRDVAAAMHDADRAERKRRDDERADG